MTPAQWQWRLGAGAALLVVVLLVLGFWQTRLVLAATLSAAVGCIDLVLGCLLLSLITPLIRGAWQPLLAPGARLGSLGVPLILPMLVPMLLGLNWLYPWVGAPVSGFRGVWLSPWFFSLRSVVYALVWWWLWRGAQRGSLRLLPAGLIVYVLMVSLAAVDWLMSLQPGFVSSLFGLLSIARQLLNGLAFAGLLALLTQPAVRLDVLRGLLVAALAFWIYLQFVQYLIIWSVNLPHEVQWYWLREQGVWAGLTLVLMVGQVLCLIWLASPLGRSVCGMARGCGLLLALAALESLWKVMPSVTPLPGAIALLVGLLAQLAYAGLLAVWLLHGFRRGGAHG